MQVLIKLFATLRNGRFEEEVHEFPPGTTISGVIETLGLPGSQVTLILLNGCHALPSSELHEGDTLSLFPPIGGG